MYFAIEGTGVGDVFLGGVGVDWGSLVRRGLKQLGRRGMCLRSVRLSGLFCSFVRIVEIGKKQRKGRYLSGLKVPSVSGMENSCQFGVDDVGRSNLGLYRCMPLFLLHRPCPDWLSMSSWT